MKALLINGSPRENGNTARALKEVAATLNREGIETEIVWIGRNPVRGCVGCCACRTKQLGRCIFDDDIANRIVEKLPSAEMRRLAEISIYLDELLRLLNSPKHELAENEADDMAEKIAGLGETQTALIEKLQQ